MRGWMLLIGVVAMPGCLRQSFTTEAPAGGFVHRERAHFFVLGLVGEHDVQLAEICPQGVSHFENSMTLLDGLFAMFTFGLYTPLTIQVKCASGQAYRLSPDPPRGVTWVDLEHAGGAR